MRELFKFVQCLIDINKPPINLDNIFKEKALTF
ncbi:hypothetical protein BDD26_0785 [Xenorhabdus cabanillasii]|uniref:Uncharacterized protein n=1 Tax=Xenorhabdus cabanillasii TaxID=351673 RepID=A0A3D9UAH2_9GAMM|nr:hypothetical protein Xcab_02083 [Xenorhabdus cabanillasii JM26]REF26187.1 hypothetical protein BDD26_0785 [Xenorhabdus cabanillasii]